MNDSAPLSKRLYDDLEAVLRRYEMLGATVVVGFVTNDVKTGSEGLSLLTSGSYFTCLGLAMKIMDALQCAEPLEGE